MSSLAIDAGTRRRSGLRVGSFAVSEVEFASGCRLAWHAHPRACVAVVVGGVVRKRFARFGTDATEGTVVSMPARESHEDLFGREGARLLVVETDADAVRSVSWFRDWGATVLAARAARELAVPDAFTPLALEGLALELLAVVGRGPLDPRPPNWLANAHELLQECFRDPPSAAEIAAQVGVHPSHLARSFRLHYGDSLGGHARRLRLEWAAGRLDRTDISLACIAAEAGFVDQSHFTRAFKRHFGVTPARYRNAHR